jgi:elongation factor 1-alpha
MKEWAEENYYGKTEYKLKLINKSKERIQGLITQMKFRLREGNGTCFYEIGLEDNGNPLGLNEEELKQSIDTIYLMTQEIGAQMDIMNFFEGKQGLIAEVMITKSNSSESKMSLELRIGLIGEEGAGKSTLVKIFDIGGLLD